MLHCVRRKSATSGQSIVGGQRLPYSVPASLQSAKVEHQLGKLTTYPQPPGDSRRRPSGHLTVVVIPAPGTGDREAHVHLVVAVIPARAVMTQEGRRSANNGPA